jgi:hypothetical protein
MTFCSNVLQITHIITKKSGMNTVIFFRPKLREFLRFPLNRNFVINFVWIGYSEVSVAKNPGINTRNLCKANNFGLKIRNFGFQKQEILGRKNEVLVPEVLVPEVSVQETRSFGSKPRSSVKVVFRNASVAETRNFELL